jgi:hypothetical protein
MSPNEPTNGVNSAAPAPDSAAACYSIPLTTAQILQTGLLQNPLIAPTLPPEISECAAPIRFVGTDKPSIPINWKFAESIASLKGLEAAMINVLLKRKYGVEPQEVVIDT